MPEHARIGGNRSRSHRRGPSTALFCTGACADRFVTEPREGRALWVGHSPGCDDVGKFYDLLDPERCAKMKAIELALSEYAWPGNTRELENVIEPAVILSNRGTLHINGAIAVHSKRSSGRTPSTFCH